MTHFWGALDHKYFFIDREIRENRNINTTFPIEVDASLFLGKWQGEIESYDKISLLNGEPEVHIFVIQKLTDPKYKFETKLRDVFLLTSNDLQSLLEQHSTDGGVSFIPPIECTVNVILNKHPMYLFSQVIDFIEIAGRMFYKK